MVTADSSRAVHTLSLDCSTATDVSAAASSDRSNMAPPPLVHVYRPRKPSFQLSDILVNRAEVIRACPELPPSFTSIIKKRMEISARGTEFEADIKVEDFGGVYTQKNTALNLKQLVLMFLFGAHEYVGSASAIVEFLLMVLRKVTARIEGESENSEDENERLEIVVNAAEIFCTLTNRLGSTKPIVCKKCKIRAKPFHFWSCSGKKANEDAACGKSIHAALHNGCQFPWIPCRQEGSKRDSFPKTPIQYLMADPYYVYLMKILIGSDFPMFCAVCGPRYVSSREVKDTNKRNWLNELAEMMWLKYAFYFNTPVDKAIYPQYYVIIKEPMDLQTVLFKVRKGLITSEREFVDHVNLVFENSMTFNLEGSWIWNVASDMKRKFKALHDAYKNSSNYVEDVTERVELNQAPSQVPELVTLESLIEKQSQLSKTEPLAEQMGAEILEKSPARQQRSTFEAIMTPSISNELVSNSKITTSDLNKKKDTKPEPHKNQKGSLSHELQPPTNIQSALPVDSSKVFTATPIDYRNFESSPLPILFPSSSAAESSVPQSTLIQRATMDSSSAISPSPVEFNSESNGRKSITSELDSGRSDSQSRKRVEPPEPVIKRGPGRPRLSAKRIRVSESSSQALSSTEKASVSQLVAEVSSLYKIVSQINDRITDMDSRISEQLKDLSTQTVRTLRRARKEVKTLDDCLKDAHCKIGNQIGLDLTSLENITLSESEEDEHINEDTAETSVQMHSTTITDRIPENSSFLNE